MRNGVFQMVKSNYGEGLVIMAKSKKLVMLTWLLTLIFILCAFLPVLQFSFNDYPVNILGICEEFDSRNRAGLRHFAPLGYATFVVIALTALAQVWYLIAAVKDASKAKGKRKFSAVMTTISIAALAGYLLLVFGRSNYTLTGVPFIFAAVGITYIILSEKILKLHNVAESR
jgi:magnesium-transporting ATPase (P-type)